MLSKAEQDKTIISYSIILYRELADLSASFFIFSIYEKMFIDRVRMHQHSIFGTELPKENPENQRPYHL